MLHRFTAPIIVLLSFLALSAAPPSTKPLAAKPALSEPSISPDGAEIAFVSGGDIWSVRASGGEARLLVADPAAESRPLYSPDGKYLAFTSTRTGNGDVYVLTLATGDLKRLTFDDATEPVEGWSPDSRYVYFSSSAHDISGMNDIYRVSIEGGTPMAVSADRYVNEFFAAPAPDGKTVAFSAHGIANAQWWRHGRSHLDESEIWTVFGDAEPKYTKLVDAGAKDLWPMWSADGATLYFMSDRSGVENIWSLAKGEKKQITHFTDGRVLWPAIAHNGRAIVFERNFGIWKLDLGSGKAAPVAIELRGVPASAGVEHEKFTDRISEFALSPDGKKVVFAVHGELFAASAKDGGDGIRLTHTEARESAIAWAPDSRRIAYVSDREGRDHLYLYDFGTYAETQLTRGNGVEESPRWSPDGKLLAFLRNRSDLIVYNVADKTETAVASAVQERWPSFGGSRVFDWSPDSKWIGFLSYGDRMFRNASVVQVAGGKAQPVSFLANVSGGTISWSPDGKYLLMETNQRTENGVVARVDLVPHTPAFHEDQFRDLFKEQKPPSIERNSTQEQKPAETEAPKDADKPKDAKEAETKPEDKKGPAAHQTKVVFDGIRERLSILPVGVDVGWQTISPDGKWLAVIADAAGQQNIYVYSLDELSKEPAVAKQLTSTPGRKSDVQFTSDSKEVFYLDRGKINSVTLDTPKPKPLAVAAEMDVDFASEKTEAFEEAWRYLQEGFFDRAMNGANWKAVHDEIEPYAEGARSPDDLRRVISLMIGELNSSHSGIGAPAEERKTSTGRLGLRFDRAEYERNGKLKVSEVVDLGPASIAGIKVGDTITEVQGTAIGPHTNIDELLEYTIGKRIAVTAESPGAMARVVVLKPVNLVTEKGLLYRQWVNDRRAYVERMSHGELGYVHMADMSDRALTQLALDLDAQNFGRKGVIVDVRNNNGGFVNAYALDILARRPYLNMTFRGFDKSVPARTILGQRALELPTVLVTNQHSLSDAEDFTEGYRALGLGKVVGEPTAGWIIYTGGVQLIDGSTVRMPHIRVTDHEGKPMEMHPRPVDYQVENPVGQTYTGKDSQLDEAIKVLLDQVEGSKTKVAE
jgi:tricorn protease